MRLWSDLIHWMVRKHLSGRSVIESESQSLRGWGLVRWLKGDKTPSQRNVRCPAQVEDLGCFWGTELRLLWSETPSGWWRVRNEPGGVGKGWTTRTGPLPDRLYSQNSGRLLKNVMQRRNIIRFFFLSEQTSFLEQFCAKPLQSWLSPSGSSVHGIAQARVLEWVAMAFSRASSPPRDRTRISYICIGKWVLYH